MDINQPRELVIQASSIDNRVVRDPAISLWHELLGHVAYADAVWALRDHRLNKAGFYFEPGSVIDALKRRRQAAELKPIDQRTCDIHLNYPLPCPRCWSDMEEHGAIQPVTMVHLGHLTAPIGKTP